MIPQTAANLILEHADDNGQITWREASLIATCYGVWSEFAEIYGPLLISGEGVDAGELLTWIADPSLGALSCLHLVPLIVLISSSYELPLRY